MSYRFRAATPADAPAVRTVHLAAFPTSTEADLVAQLERDGDAAISLVADDGGIVGHVLFSRMAVVADGSPLEGLGLGPIAVKPALQGKGIGSLLIRAGLEAARETADIVFVLGEPAYYGRFGFSAAAAAPFASPYAGPYFQALHLTAGTVPRTGSAEYPPAFANLA